MMKFLILLFLEINGFAEQNGVHSELLNLTQVFH